MQHETIRRGEGFRFDEDRVRVFHPAGRVVTHHPAPDVTEIVSSRDLAAGLLMKPEILRLHATSPRGRIALLAASAAGGDATVAPAFAALCNDLLAALR